MLTTPEAGFQSPPYIPWVWRCAWTPETYLKSPCRQEVFGRRFGPAGSVCSIQKFLTKNETKDNQMLTFRSKKNRDSYFGSVMFGTIRMDGQLGHPSYTTGTNHSFQWNFRSNILTPTGPQKANSHHRGCWFQEL